MKKRMLSLVLVIAMVLTMAPHVTHHAHAAEGDPCTVAACTGTFSNGICSVCGGYEPAVDSDNDGYYEIGNAGQLYWFAGLVNGTLTDGTSQNSSARAVLTEDLTVNEGVLTNGALNGDGSAFTAWTPIGSSNNPYGGTFDGQDHTISGLYYNNSSGYYVGLFGSANGSAIRNVRVKDSYFNGKKYVGGIVGYTNYSAVENCHNGGAAVSGADSVDGDSVGGVVGSVNNNSSVTKCSNSGAISGTYYVGGIAGDLYQSTASNCYNLGSVTSNADHAGGIVGNTNGSTVTSCFNMGQVRGTTRNSSHIGAVVGRNYEDSTISNNYYLSGCAVNGNGRVQGAVGYYNSNGSYTDPYGRTAGQFASGEVAYLLNSGATDGTQVWHQTIDADAYPSFTGGTVYYGYEDTSCDSETTYSNDELPETKNNHSYSAETGLCAECGSPCSHSYTDGVCGECGYTCPHDSYTNGVCDECGYNCPHDYSSSDICSICGAVKAGVTSLTITNQDELEAFIAAVNTGNTILNGVLAADGLTLSTPIGTSTYNYAGTFDGQGHTLNISLDGGENMAPFAYVNGAAIQNLTTTGTINASGKYAAGLVSHVYGSTAITKCLSLVTINSTKNDDGTHGGLVGVNEANATLTITNCAFLGEINGDGTNSCGGLVGWCNAASTVSATNCYVAATFTVNSSNSNTFGRNSDFLTLINCYYLHPLGDTPAEGATQKDAAAFASGEVTYLLNSGVTDSTQVWYQTIGEDAFPNFTGGTVYQVNGVYANSETIPATGVTLSESTLALKKGDTATLTATPTPAYTTDTATWESSNPAVATVENGVVTAVGGGTATITVTVGGFTATCQVTVTVPVTGVTLNETELTLEKGEETTITATVSPEDATDTAVTWESSDPAIATVDEKGKVTAVGGGTATITATTEDGGFTATCQVTVTVSVTGVTLNETELTLEKGEETTLTATISPEDATDTTVTWTSSNTDVATVESGVVTAVSPGETTITATVGEKSATCTVTVVVSATGVSLSQTTLDLETGNTTTLTATVTPADTTDAVTWSSDNETVVTVDNGAVTAVGAGDATITVTAGGFTATCTVKVHDYSNNGFCSGHENCYQPAELVNCVYQISNAGQLYWFADKVNNDSGNFGSAQAVLTADITVNPGTFDANGSYTPKGGEALRMWTPIGSSSNNYSGTFNGQGHTISGLWCSERSAGLFGRLSSGAAVSNITVTNSYFHSSTDHAGAIAAYVSQGAAITSCTNSGTVTGEHYAGGIAGINRGAITACTNSGAVTGESYTGGIAGSNYGTITNCTNSGAVTGTIHAGGITGSNDGTIANCGNSGAVASEHYTGGIAGSNNGTITACTNSGTVTGGAYTGGIAGSNNGTGTITACGSSGSVTGERYAGGVAGYNRASAAVAACYNFGAVTSGSYTGGITGWNDGGSLQYCCYNKNAFSGDAVGNEVLAITAYGLTAEEFERGVAAYLMNLYDTTTYWYQNIDNDQPRDNLPTLDSTHGMVYGEANTCEGVVTGYSVSNSSDITPEELPKHDFSTNGFCVNCDSYQPAELVDGVYQISNVGQLYWFADKVNNDSDNFCYAQAVLTADITVNPGTFDTDGSYTPAANETLRAWTPIGDSNGFYGTFNGQGHTISGLWCSETTAASLFSENLGTIRDLGVINSIFISPSGDAAPIASVNTHLITGCWSEGCIIVGDFAAGITAILAEVEADSQLIPQVTECWSSSTLTGFYVGGMVAMASTGEITDCYFTGTIRCYLYAADTRAGGIVGISQATVKNCWSSAQFVLETEAGTETGALIGAIVAHAITETKIDGTTVTYPTPENCYYYQSSDNIFGVGATDIEVYDTETGEGNSVITVCTGDLAGIQPKTSEEFASGEVTYLLNGSSSEEGVIWKQTLGTDAFPNFTGNIIYLVENQKCDGALINTFYSNTNENIRADHSYSSEWSTDATRHCHQCSCGAKADDAAHSDPTTDQDHLCDTCGYAMADHSYSTEWSTDTTHHWHLCDCGEKEDYEAHSDATVKDHLCDTCRTRLGNCIDSLGDGDHNCDHCGKKLSNCSDSEADKDHNCDECGDSLSDCTDGDKNHKCDTCGATMGTHADSNKDHSCDYGCSETIGACEDDDKDHDCDYGCTKTYGDHSDAGKDHICDYGCSETIGTCEDADMDHGCDYGCDKVYGDHQAAEGKHTCDYCGVALSECADVSTDSDHNCDTCGKKLSNHRFSSEWTCDDDKHWHECDCGAKSNEAAHSYGDPVFVWAEDYSGCTAVFRCSCGYVTETPVTVTVEGSVLKLSHVPTDMILMIAGYDSNGKMTGCQVVTDPSESITVTVTGVTIQAFFLGSGTHAPLMKPLPIK